MSQVGTELAAVQKQLEEAGIGSGRLDALILMEQATGLTRVQLLGHPHQALDASAQKKLDALVAKRRQRQPISQLTGQKEFYGLSFKITADVLAPRPETERLVEMAIAQAPTGSKVLDMGTGCGAIAIALARHRPDLDITATDVSAAALKVATVNAKLHQAKIKLGINNLWQGLDQPFDVIVANLPYLPTAQDIELMPETKFEPEVALFGGQDGLELYRSFFADLEQHLTGDGLVMVESDPWQQPELIKLAQAAGLAVTDQDYFVLGFRRQTQPT